MANTPPPKLQSLLTGPIELPEALSQYDMGYARPAAIHVSVVPEGSKPHHESMSDQAQAKFSWRLDSSTPWSREHGVGAWRLVWDGSDAEFVGQAFSQRSLRAAAHRVVTDPANKAEFQDQALRAHVLLAQAAGLDKLVLAGGGSMSCEFIDAAMYLSNRLLMDIKNAIRLPRPFEAHVFGTSLSPLIKPPGFTSHPGGHACQAALVADLLRRLKDQDLNQAGRLFDLAWRIATNRERAGLHTDIETSTGWSLGLWLADLLCNATKATPLWQSALVDAKKEW